MQTSSKSFFIATAILSLPMQGMEYLEKYATPIATTIFIGGGIVAYGFWKLTSPKAQFTIDQFLKDPEALRKQTEKALDPLRAFDKAPSLAQALIAFKKVVHDEELKLPICFLGECSDETPWCPCILNRNTNPQFRNLFEDQVRAALVEKIDGLQAPVVYTSFGSGGMFQDFTILVKTLAQKPNAKLHINLIDRQYWLYVDCLHKLNQPRTVGTNYRHLIN